MPDLSTTWTRRRHIKSGQSPSSGIYWQHYTSSLMILPEAAVPTSSPTVHRTPRPNHVPGHRVGVLRGSAATLLCGALSLALGAAVVLAVGCGLLTVAALGRALGRSLDGLDALAVRLTPALLRRAVAVTVSTGLGLAAATGAASASEPDLGGGLGSARTGRPTRGRVGARGRA